MSRAAQSKSRAEKKGGQSAPTPAVTHEIVPGKFTDVDWNRMLELDDGEDFVGELIDEALNETLDIIYKKYIDKQLLPYTVSQAKEAILTIIDWRFITCDSGEEDTESDPLWNEDEEPTAAVPDCWAQGSVPRRIAPARVSSAAGSDKDEGLSMLVEEVDGDEGEPEIKMDEQPQPWEVKDDDIIQDEPVKEEPAPVQMPKEQIETKVPSPTPPPTKKKTKFRPKKGRLISAGVSNMAESLEDTERRLTTEEARRRQQDDPPPQKPMFSSMPKSVGSILKSPVENEAASQQFQSGRPPGNRDVYYDNQGNIIAMSKISPEKLPTHSIKTKFYVVDPAVEAAQARLDAMRTGRYLATKKTTRKPAHEDRKKLDKSSDYKSSKSDISRVKYNGHEGKPDTVTPLPPPMIESMELAPGVIVVEGDRVKKGPRQLPSTRDKLPADDKLRPVGVKREMSISVRELLGAAAPIIRMESSTPVPPIMNKQNMDSRSKIPA